MEKRIRVKLLTRFVLLVFLFSIPLWLGASILDATNIIPVALPFSALQFLTVILAAIIVTYQGGGSVRELLLRGFDFRRIDSPFWRIGIFIIMPLNIALSYLLISIAGAGAPEQMTPLISIPIFFLIYGISAYCEEIGWTAIMTNRLLDHYSVFRTGLLVGITWALWHLIPYFQTHNSPSWIFWQCVFTIIARVLIVEVFLLTSLSVFSTVVMHATYNVAFSLLPYYGSSYDPFYMSLATLCTTIIISIVLNRRAKNSLL